MTASTPTIVGAEITQDNPGPSNVHLDLEFAQLLDPHFQEPLLFQFAVDGDYTLDDVQYALPGGDDPTHFVRLLLTQVTTPPTTVSYTRNIGSSLGEVLVGVDGVLVPDFTAFAVT